MCNCTENRLRLIPYVTTRMFTVQIRIDKTDYTTDWITRTNTCNCKHKQKITVIIYTLVKIK